MNGKKSNTTEENRLTGHFAYGTRSVDTRGQPFEFSLTEHERTIAALGTVHLEKMRRILNERDEKMAAYTKKETR